MTYQKILVTGGAGFVGVHLCRELIRRGFNVRVLDNLDPQVHGRKARPPRALPKAVEWMRGDVTRPADVERAVNGVDAIFHLAAAVGVGQSMYQVRHYVNTNSMGGATVLEAVVRHRRQLRKVIVASSMSIYGEGLYQCPRCGPVSPQNRTAVPHGHRDWDIHCDACGSILDPRPTPETKRLNPTSVYAVTKRDHEEQFLAIGSAYRVPTVALRFFNIYGPLQALSNPYTGVAAIFSSRLINSQPPLIFEDGRQSRDFVHVSDIVQACVLSLTKPKANYQVLNVGTGRPMSVLQLARLLAEHLNVAIEPRVLNRFRAGDIRSCYADISRIEALLGYKPKVSLEKGIPDLISWVARQNGKDSVPGAMNELSSLGLIR
jgi:dTDP-L-rhamnose 4-epimerase